MPENAPVVIVPTSFPEGYCPANWQTLANDLASGMSGYVPGSYNFFNYGTSEPGVNDRNKPWYRLNPDGSPDKWFVFFAGSWVAPHPVEASSEERKIWTGIESDVWAYDGGDGNNPSVTAPTDSTGAMWEVDHDFDFRFPLGAGTSPAPASTTVNSGDTGGEENHVLAEDELAEHTHFVASTDNVANLGGSGNSPTDLTASTFVAGAANQGGAGDNSYALAKTATEATVGLTSPTGESDPHNNMPPYRGVFFLKRTARLFYVP